MKLDKSHPQVKATAAVMAQLDGLRPELRCAFGASCAERLFPMYQAFSLESVWGDVPKLRHAIDELWDVALLKRGTDEVYSEADLFALAPLSSEHAGRFVAGAQLAVACVIHAWNALTATDSAEALWCSVVSRDCISEYLQWVAAPIYGEKHEVANEDGEMIDWFGHPLMDHEMKKQFADLELLHRRTRLDEWTAWELRSAGARGIAPFIRRLIVPLRAGKPVKLAWGFENMHVVDMITRAQDGTSTLIILGPDSWTASTDNQFILRHKIDTYVEYIESGDFYDDNPDRKGDLVGFQFANFAPMPAAMLQTIEQLKTRLRDEHGIPLDVVDL